jgi:hypothetical protein
MKYARVVGYVILRWKSIRRAIKQLILLKLGFGYHMFHVVSHIMFNVQARLSPWAQKYLSEGETAVGNVVFYFTTGVTPFGETKLI